MSERTYLSIFMTVLKRRVVITIHEILLVPDLSNNQVCILGVNRTQTPFMSLLSLRRALLIDQH